MLSLWLLLFLGIDRSDIFAVIYLPITMHTLTVDSFFTDGTDVLIGIDLWFFLWHFIGLLAEYGGVFFRRGGYIDF